MPNLVMTYQCNDDCSYCFVEERNDTCLNIEKVIRLLPLISDFKQRDVNLVGGEPTLNPDFMRIVELLVGEGFKVRIFTNGRISMQIIEELQNLDGEFTLAVNRTRPSLSDELKTLYRKLGHRIQLTATIYRPDISLGHLFDEILTYRLEHYYRVGIALPIWPDGQNTFLKPELYPQTAGQLFAEIQIGVQYDIRPNFDCGFPLCFFTPKQRQYLIDHQVQFHSHCGPIPDIGPDLNVIPCFPLAKFRQPIEQGWNWQKSRQLFVKSMKDYKASLLFEQCRDCKAINSEKCNGGCAALRLMLNKV